MGCGHSKLHIYHKKSRSKNSKKSVAPEKSEAEEEDGVENSSENADNVNDCDLRKTIKVKPLGPLCSQTEISTSQQDFFKMLEDRIENGPDYDSESEIEKAAEATRLSSLLKDWETASAGSRSLPVTPIRRPKPIMGARSVDNSALIRPKDRNYNSEITPNFYQAYGYPPISYQQIPYNYIPNTSHPTYPPPPNIPLQHQILPHQIPLHQSSSHYIPAYSPAMQYAASPMYNSPNMYQHPPQPPPVRQYLSYNQQGSPVKTYVNSPKHIPYNQQAIFSPSHKPYGPPIGVPPTIAKQTYSNGELRQKQMYTQQHVQYQVTREQVFAQLPPQGSNYVAQHRSRRSYQSSSAIPILKQGQTSEEANSLHREDYELT